MLPSFEVKLTPERPFFYVDGTELDVNIRATYVKVFILWLKRSGFVGRLSKKQKLFFRGCAGALLECFVFLSVLFYFDVFSKMSLWSKVYFW